MKKLITLALVAVLLLSLCACGQNGGTYTPAQTTPVSQTSTPASQQSNSPLPENVTYKAEYKLQGDPGDGLSDTDAAALLFNTVSSIIEYKAGDAVNITLIGTDYVAGAECYFYSIKTAKGSESNYAVDYGNDIIYVRSVESGEYNLLAGVDDSSGGTVDPGIQGDPGDTIDPGTQGDPGDTIDPGNQGDPGDTRIPQWWGSFKGENFAIDIDNVGENSFHFLIYFLRNGSTTVEGTAALYPDNNLMAEYGEFSFSLSEDFSTIDIFASESSEWELVPGRYNRLS